MPIKKIVIRTADVPGFLSVFSYIKYRTDIQQRFRRLPSPPNQVHHLPLNYPVSALAKSAQHVLEKYGVLDG